MKLRLGRKETGLEVYPKQPQEDRERLGIAGLFVMFLYFYLGVFGSVHTLFKILKITYDVKLVSLEILLYGIYLILIYFTGKYRRVAFIVTALLYGGAIVVNYQNIMSLDIKILVFLAVFLWESILFFGITIKGGRILSVINFALILSSGMMVGRIPDFAEISMILLYCIGNFAMGEIGDKKRKQEAGIFMAVIVVALLVISQRFIAPYLQPLFTDAGKLKGQIQSTAMIQGLADELPTWGEKAGIGGVGQGELNNVESFDESDARIVAVVTTKEKPESDIYLKGYVGSVYTGEVWGQIVDEDDEAIKHEYFTLFESMEQKADTMKILIKDKSERYVYEPYYASLRSTERDEYEYEYYPLGEMKQWQSDSTVIGADEYEEFVYENYLDYPSERLGRLAAQCFANPKEDTDAIANYIKTTLKDTAKYNLQVGLFPEDEDFTEYFLYEKKEGYCVHFATAATLMFRIYGVPARFVSGYIVPRGQFMADAEGYTAKVEGKSAHAWVEIYQSGKGWTPVETTPAYAGLDVSEEQQSEIERDALKQSEREIAPSNGAVPKGNVINGWIYTVAVISALVIFGVLMTLRRRRILRDRKRKPAKEIFHDIVKVLELGGLPKAIECGEQDFAAEIATRFSWFEETEIKEMMRIVMKANFAGEKVTREENRYMRLCYRDICRHVGAALPVWKRLLMQYVFGYY